MKKNYILLVLMLIMLITGCSGGSDPVPAAQSSLKTITTFSLNGVVGTINETDKTITVTMPSGTNVTNLVAQFTTTGSSVKVGTTVQISGTTAHNFTGAVIYIVTAADSTTQDYEVTVTVASSSEKAITAFSLNGVVGTINESDKTIAVTMPFGTSVKALLATFATTGTSVKVGSTIQISGTTAHNFTSPVVYTVQAADVTTQDYTVTVTVEKLVMISVPAGSFQRDATYTNISNISMAFHMSETEITRAQFLAITGVDPSYKPYSAGTTAPVQQVNWYHALVFCNKLSVIECLTPVYSIGGSTNPDTWGTIPTSNNAIWDAAIANWSADGYRLPTEMEWMWAAMGATSGFGYTSPIYLNGYLKAFAGSTGSNAIGDYAWLRENSDSTTHTVGTKLPNELGLYDMSGNVVEWCWDWEANYPDGTLTSNTGRGAASGMNRVVRGGNRDNDASLLTIAFRTGNPPYIQYHDHGFRVVRN
jgi:formylglycine-generating enzyme required for sulfatase activity